MNDIFKKILHEITCDVKNNDWACKTHDIERASFTSGHFAAYCHALRMLGYKVDDGSYTDEGCDRIAYLKINDEVIMKNSEWQDAY